MASVTVDYDVETSSSTAWQVACKPFGPSPLSPRSKTRAPSTSPDRSPVPTRRSSCYCCKINIFFPTAFTAVWQGFRLSPPQKKCGVGWSVWGTYLFSFSLSPFVFEYLMDKVAYLLHVQDKAKVVIAGLLDATCLVRDKRGKGKRNSRVDPSLYAVVMISNPELRRD